MSFCTIAQFFARYDRRVIAQLSNDVNSVAQLDTNIQACLDDATSDIKTAALVGKIYSATDLTTLVSSGDTQLVRLNADIALGYIYNRRAMGVPANLKDVVDRANDQLNALKRGERVLNVTAAINASLPVMVNLSPLDQLNLQQITATPFFGEPCGTPSTP